MAEISSGAEVNTGSRFSAFMAQRRGLVRDYFTAVSGSAGRLVFSLIYFVALVNSLSLGDFGMFATASAAGVVLSRLLAFGFISALYRTATIRPRLIGVFTGGFLMLAMASLPLIAAASWLTYLVFFAGAMPPLAFATVVATEALVWRPLEVVMIVNNGAGRFGRSAFLSIASILIRAVAAGLFLFAASHDLQTWALWYLAANLVSLVLGCAFFYPRQRIRLAPRLYRRRMMDSIYVAASEVLFYLQMEFDKLLVLSFGGPQLAGIYAIVMRLVDLTAIPIRTFSMMLVQKMMRAPELLARLKIKISIEAGIFVVSTLGMAALAVILHFFPAVLGRNVAEAAPLMLLTLAIPGLRNLIEYQAELLFARGQTLQRSINLAVLAALKCLILVVILKQVSEPSELVSLLNAGFLLLYAVSALLTYTALRRPAKKI